MKKTILALFVITILFLINISFAVACSCIEPFSPKESLKKSSAVFAGKVVDIDMSKIMFSSADPVKVTFEVSKIWKGFSYKTLVVTTARSEASCGYSFKQGEEYIVYVRGEENNLKASLCSRTKLFSNAQEDLKELGEGSLPTIENSNLSNKFSFPKVFIVGIGILVIIAAILLIKKNFKK